MHDLGIFILGLFTGIGIVAQLLVWEQHDKKKKDRSDWLGVDLF
jgi:hypothetical protein